MTPEEEKELYEKKRTALFQAIKKMKVNATQNAKTRSHSPMTSKYTVVQVENFMKNPLGNQKQLRQLSNYLYNVSPEYRQIINYVSSMPSYSYVIDTLNVLDEKTDFKSFEKAKLKVAQRLSKMSLSHELGKALKVAWKQDVFYGYEHETEDSFFIQHMDADYCRISSVDYDGVFLYEFDFSYFNLDKTLLSNYPEEFQKKYQQYQITKENWIELNSERAFAFKINEEITNYPLLPYAVLFEPIFDLEEYKKIQKARIKMDNFMLLTQQIPLNDKAQGMDEFLISLETAMEFHNLIVSGLDEGVGFLTSPMKIEAIKTEKSNKDKDAVAMALRGVFDAGGISQFLFNSDKNTSTGVGKSVIVDEQLVFRTLRQIERWLNRKIRRMSGKFKFKVRMLNISSFDEGESFNMYLTGAQSGFPSIDEAAAAIGISHLDLHNKLMIENSSIGFQNKMKPLATSHTQSSKDAEGAGRSKVSDDKTSDSTIINRDANTDENKANN